MVNHQPQEATEAELTVLQALWERGPSAIRPLSALIYERADTSTYSTVQKLLERLESKGLVKRDRSKSVHTFAAAVDRDAFLGQRLRDLADSLCGGSWAPILTHLAASSGHLSTQERQSLRALVDQLDARKPKS